MHAIALWLGIGLAGLTAALGHGAEGFRLPPGFTIHEYAGPELANDIYLMTIDEDGRVWVSGRGYLRVLLDRDGDGKADHAETFLAGPRDGAMGLLVEGETVWCVGDGMLGRYRDANGDLRADGPAERILTLKTGGEHDAHAVRRGPDGWLYLLVGNGTKLPRGFATTRSSPIGEPVAGSVVRISPDLRQREIVADGFRNAYAMDFNLDGELFTYDSDNERCVSLPWYEPTRFYHVVPGGHYGWQSPERGETWRYPPHFVDVVAPAAAIARGSPTGVVCYRHHQFPGRYHGGFFLLDWTFGRIYFAALKPVGSTYRADVSVFLEAQGDNGFAPTAAAVHPQSGDLFVSIGGRGTRGAVYRIQAKPDPARVRKEGRFVEPRTLPKAKVAALAEVMAAALGRAPRQRRHALDALAAHPERLTLAERERVVKANWDDEDRLLRQSAARMVATMPPAVQQRLLDEADSHLSLTTAALGVARAAPKGLTERLMQAFETAPSERRVELLRLLQLVAGGQGAPAAHGTVWEGYQAVRSEGYPASVVARLAACFPTGVERVDFELARTLALTGQGTPELLERVTAQWTPSSDPVRDIHYLICAARLPGPASEGVPRRVAEALLALDAKLGARKLARDRNWPLRLREVHERWVERAPTLHAEMLAHPSFGRIDHTLFALHPTFDRVEAGRRLLAWLKAHPEVECTPEALRLIGASDEALAEGFVRAQWESGSLRGAAIEVLARQPRQADRRRFVAGLSDPDMTIVEISLEALDRLPTPRQAKTDPEELAALVAVYRRSFHEEAQRLRKPALEQLERLTGVSLGDNRQAWARWLAANHPSLTTSLEGDAGVDLTAWRRRLATVDWRQGSRDRGAALYRQWTCAGCHDGGRTVGPDLRGVTRRFSREDLFTAIVAPDRDVSPRYQAHLVATTTGQTYLGIVIYEAVDSLILQTGAEKTVRVPVDQISERRPSLRSLMPSGLLDRATPSELADLYAYLESLTP